MREPDIHESHKYVDEPHEAFDEIEEILVWAFEVRFYTDVTEHPWGDVLEINLEYVNPEGRQVDVDAFRPTHHDDYWIIDFGIELPED